MANTFQPTVDLTSVMQNLTATTYGVGATGAASLISIYSRTGAGLFFLHCPYGVSATTRIVVTADSTVRYDQTLNWSTLNPYGLISIFRYKINIKLEINPSGTGSLKHPYYDIKE